jgi:hypothetical protein
MGLPCLFIAHIEPWRLRNTTAKLGYGALQLGAAVRKSPTDFTFKGKVLRAARVFALIVALASLGAVSVGWGQMVRIPGMPGIPGMGASRGTSRPPLQPFIGDLKALTGSVPTATSLRGMYLMSAQESKTAVENITVRDFTSDTTLRFFKNGTYELVYRAYWGPARMTNDPRFNGIEINEQGRVSLSSAVVLLEPERTMSLRTKNGVEGMQEILSSALRSYIARVTTLARGMTSTTQSLTLVGRCPSYQLDSACQHGMTVQYQFAPSVPTVTTVR